MKERIKGFVKVVALILLVFSLMIGYDLWKKQEGLRIEDEQTAGSLDGLSESEIQELMQNKVEEGNFSISINSNPVFPDGKSKGSLRIENSAENRYLMIVKIYLKDSDEVIFESGAIRPGYLLEYAKLDKELTKGTYDVTVYFEAYEVDSQKYVGKAASEMSILVEK